MTDFVPLRLYLDEHIWRGLPKALAQRGYDAVHACALGHIAWDDGDQMHNSLRYLQAFKA